MRVCRCTIRSLVPSLTLPRIHLCRRFQLIYRIFFHNHDDSADLRIDTILQPVFFLTDRIAKYLGRLFICFFMLIISVVVYIFYTSIFVHLLQDIEGSVKHSYWTFLAHFIFAHWLLLNIMFNYIQCARVDPGSSPNFGQSQPFDFDKAERDRMKIQQANIDKNNNKSSGVTILNLNNDDTNSSQLSLSHSFGVSRPTAKPMNVCRKCIFPKPVRAHHCSVCARCILNQDHHCPWINNCVGHFNHRYFFQFCFFLTIGSFYAATLGFTEYQHYIFGRKAFSYIDLIFGQRINDVELLPHITSPSFHYSFLFLFIVAITACVVLFGFTAWHFWLVTKGQTTIEYHINSTEKKRLKEINQKFINPYDLGFIMNWKMFLGVNEWYELLYKNFLPSVHRPFCDGVHWPRRNFIKQDDQLQKPVVLHL